MVNLHRESIARPDLDRLRRHVMSNQEAASAAAYIEELEELRDDLRLFLGTALKMLADQPPYSFGTIGTPWWDGAVDIAEVDEAELGGEVADVRDVIGPAPSYGKAP